MVKTKIILPCCCVKLWFKHGRSAVYSMTFILMTGGDQITKIYQCERIQLAHVDLVLEIDQAFF